MKNILLQILPKNILKFIRIYRNKKKYNKLKKQKKYWKYSDLHLPTQDLPFFKLTKNPSFLASLNRETRPSILFENKFNLEFDLENNKGVNCLQLGFGYNSEEYIQNLNLEIYIDNKCEAVINNLQNKIWTDIRLLIKKKQVSLRIEKNKTVPIIFSHPILVEKKNTKKKNNSNIICIILDGLTPNFFNSIPDSNTSKIDSFFSDGIMCKQVYCQGDWTLPAFSSMLTGNYPIRHGVYNPNLNETVLPSNMQTLPEVFNKSGYRTYGFSSHSRFSPAYGHARGFERFLYKKSSTLHDSISGPMESYFCTDYYAQVFSDTINHLEAHKEEDNFIFIHLFDTHSPYWPFNYLQHLSMDMFRDYSPQKSIEVENLQLQKNYNNYTKNLIETKLREVDLAMNSFFSYCKDQSWYDNTYFILSSDHGEKSLDDFKSIELSQNRVNIPLYVKGPEIKNGIDDSYIEGNIDLYASLLALGRIECPSNVDGKIWPFIGGEKRSQALSEFKQSKDFLTPKDKSFSAPETHKTKAVFRATTSL